MNNFVQHGNNVTIAAPAAVNSGALVLIGALVGVACNTAAAGAEVQIQTNGVFDLAADSASTAAVGAKAYAVPATGLITHTASGNKLLGVFLAEKVAGSTTARVRLDGISV